jgi:hypothetical protein
MTWICSRRFCWALGACILLPLAVAWSQSPPPSSDPAKSVGGPVERDSWLAYIGAGKRCGFLHTRLTRLENGQFRYIVEERILIDLLGASKEEITSRREYVVTSTYRPVSLQIEGRQASGIARARGTVREGKLEVTALRAGMERTRKVELPKGVIFEHCLEDWLRDRPKDFQAGEVLLLDEELWDIQCAAVKRRGSGQSEQVWEVDRGLGGGTVTYVYATDGTLREIKGPLAPQFLKRCTAEEAKSISYYKMADHDLLEFPLDKEIGRVDRLAEMTVRLSWTGIPFDRFQLEDERQHIVERSEKDGRFQAVVRIDRRKAASDLLPLPIRQPDLAPYLAESRYLKPRDPKLAETARRIVPSKATALEAARALSAWVATTVKPELFAETLTGPEVLECKRGKCAEYAILFASMARSVGLPTRIVLGQRLLGTRWAGHMWNEVYVGRWLTVDASVNEVGDAPALLKLTHSDSVDGTQPLRRDLTHSLSVSVEDFKSQTRLKDKFTTGIDKGVYTNAAFGCRVRLPVQEWSMEDLSKPGVATVRFRVPKEDDVLIHFAAFSLPVPLKVVTDARPMIYKDYKLVKNEEYAVGALKGRLLRFERSTGGKKVILTEILWTKGATGFIANMRAEAAAHDKHEANFRKVVSSFEQLPSEK